MGTGRTLVQSPFAFLSRAPATGPCRRQSPAELCSFDLRQFSSVRNWRSPSRTIFPTSISTPVAVERPPLLLRCSGLERTVAERTSGVRATSSGRSGRNSCAQTGKAAPLWRPKAMSTATSNCSPVCKWPGTQKIYRMQNRGDNARSISAQLRGAPCHLSQSSIVRKSASLLPAVHAGMFVHCQF